MFGHCVSHQRSTYEMIQVDVCWRTRSSPFIGAPYCSVGTGCSGALECSFWFPLFLENWLLMDKSSNPVTTAFRARCVSSIDLVSGSAASPHISRSLPIATNTLALVTRFALAAPSRFRLLYLWIKTMVTNRSRCSYLYSIKGLAFSCSSIYFNAVLVLLYLFRFKQKVC